MMSDTPVGQMPSQPPTASLANLETVAQARAELEARLAAIHSDLQLTQTVGLLFVKRQEDLKSCFDQLQQLKDLETSGESGADSGPHEQSLPNSIRDQLAIIDKEFHEGHHGILGLKGLIDAQLPIIEVQPPKNDPSARAGSILGPSALPSSTLPVQTITKPRRHKVVVPSTPSINDPAFPVQIQEELLNQVRYWTSQAEMKEKLNQEYDIKIQEQERIIDALNKQRRLREEGDERQKEDQWNLELANQDLRGQNTELQQQLSRAMHESGKIQKALTTASEQVEQFKDKEEKTAGQLELTKSRHEQDMANMRKHTANIQREKSDLVKKIDELSTTIASQKQKLSKKATMDAIALAQERDEREPESPVEAPVLIQAPPRILSNDEIVSTVPAPVPANEPKATSLARETSFAHQQSIISELQAKLSKEMTEKEKLLSEKDELAKMLVDREETIETLRLENTISDFGSAPVSASSHAAPVSSGEKTLMEPESPAIGELNLGPSFGEESARTSSQRPSRAVSPAPSGGLFAELAHASAISTPVEAPKPAVECKDQEVMTEPIESWIHTIPGFEKPEPKPQVEEKEVQVEAEEKQEEKALAVEEKAIQVDEEKAQAEEKGVQVDEEKAQAEEKGVQVDEEKVQVVEEKAQQVVQTSDVMTSTPTVTLVNFGTSMDAVEATPAVALVDMGTSTDAIEAAPTVASTDIGTSTDAIEAAPAVALVDIGTSTDAVEAAPAVASADIGTSTDAVEAAPAVASADIGTSTDAIEAAPAVALVDIGTSTDVIEAAPAVVSVDIGTSTDAVEVVASTPAVVLVDIGTSTDDLPFSAPAPISARTESLPQSQRSGQPAGIDTGKTGSDKASQPLQDSNVTTPTVTGLEIASVQLAEPSAAPIKATAITDSSKQPVPRSNQSEIPVDDERRHTCDMSQSIPESATSQSAPPVPALSKAIIQHNQSVEIGLPSATDGQEFRVSFGSAFGDPSGVVVETGRIQPVYSDSNTTSPVSESKLDSPQDSNIPPARPTTGPPSTLLARAARASMASLVEPGTLGEPMVSAFSHTNNIDNNITTVSANTSGIMTESYNNNSSHANTLINNTNMEIAQPRPSLSAHGSPSYPPRTASLRNEPRMMNSSPPPRSMNTGAAIISSTTRTAYTFNQNSSQVHVPGRESQYQHITDSSGASIGRHKYRPSPNGSISSVSTDYGGGAGSGNGGRDPHDRRMSVSSNYDATATDPTMIQIITQTMIGDYLWKYTRRPMANVISEKRHRRYFWVHPYTKTMYWGLNNPAADGSREHRAKSALIVAVWQITDDNPSPNSDLPNVSLLVQTSSRNLKLTAPTRQKHDLWYQSLSYLLSRPTTPGGDVSSDTQTWSEVQATRGVASDTLLTIRQDKTIRKKSSFNRLQNIFGRSKETSPVGSPKGGAQLGSGTPMMASTSSLHQPPHLLGQQGLVGGGTSISNTVVGYPSHMAHAGNVVGGYGTVNGGPIMSHMSSLEGASPQGRQGEYEDDEELEDEDLEDDLDDDDEDDGVLPEHIRQCCDGKHDIGALHHHH